MLSANTLVTIKDSKDRMTTKDLKEITDAIRKVAKAKGFTVKFTDDVQAIILNAQDF